MNGMIAGKRDVKMLGREAKNLRSVTLLSTGAVVKIDPSRWVQIAGAKQFDDASTAFLRVSKHKYVEDKFLVHGLRAHLPVGEKKTAVDAEAYELIASREQVGPTLAKVAEHCGIGALVEEVAWKA